MMHGWRVLATVLLLWGSLRGADAAAAPGIADGLAWLAAQVTTTGTLIREAESLALAGAAPAPLLAGLAGPPSPAEPTEFLFSLAGYRAAR